MIVAMSNLLNIDLEDDQKKIIDTLRKTIQSANLNIILGSGCSAPAIKTLGNIEDTVQKLFASGKSDEAYKKLFDFSLPLLESTQALKEAGIDKTEPTLMNYCQFLEILSGILSTRAPSILPKQATIFTTNYDLFIEKSYDMVNVSTKLSDGFNRNSIFDTSFRYSTTEFFNSVFNNGNLYNYRVQIPSINLIKVHGSLSWRIDSGNIRFQSIDPVSLIEEHKNIEASGNVAAMRVFLQKLIIVLPVKDKFHDTIMNQAYYDLLRIYANELDKENTVLIAEGFSFADEHIREITIRALKNPTLKLIIFCYSKADRDVFEGYFKSNRNVDIVFSETTQIDFKKFNELFSSVIPLHAALGLESNTP